jgi:hypothetical protein
MSAYLWFSNTRKFGSHLMSTLDGWTIASSNGSMVIRPDSMDSLMVRSEKIIGA